MPKAKNEVENDFLKEIHRMQGKAINSKKRKNSKQKGNRGERDMVQILNDRFEPHKFMRAPMSGAYFGQTNYNKNKGMEEHVIETLSSDIITPSAFSFAIEHKSYSNDSIRINYFLSEKEYKIHDWWKQCCEDAAKTNKQPMLVVKLDRMPRFVIMNAAIFTTSMKKKIAKYLIWMNGKEEMLVCEFDRLINFDEKFWGI